MIIHKNRGHSKEELSATVDNQGLPNQQVQNRTKRTFFLSIGIEKADRALLEHQKNQITESVFVLSGHYFLIIFLAIDLIYFGRTVYGR